MKKVIRLTESDLIRVIKRVIKEQSEPSLGYNGEIVKRFANDIKGKTYKFLNRNGDYIGQGIVVGAGEVTQKRQDGKGNQVLGITLNLKGVDDGKFPGRNITKQIEFNCSTKNNMFSFKEGGELNYIISKELSRPIQNEICGKLKQINQGTGL
jgi:hypothetical protein